jgi:alkylhydroperoxidase/carboxymuconolactone decarboxylase family protein YurZ
VDRAHQELLRRLAVNDEAALQAVLQMSVADDGVSGLDARTHALVRLAGLVALQSAPQCYEWGVAAALTAGATEAEVVGVVVALAPIVGVARVDRAAGEVAMALGDDFGVPDPE